MSFTRDDVAEAFDREHARVNAPAPKPAATRKPAPPQKTDPKIAAKLAKFAAMDGMAEHLAHTLHEQGVPPDHPLVQRMAERTGTTAALIRRHYAGIAAQPKKFKPPDPSALGSG